MRIPLGARETRLLQALVRANESSEPASLSVEDESALAWPELVEAARRHRLGPLVLEGARRSGLSLPAPVESSLTNDHSRELARTAVQLHELDVIAGTAATTDRRLALLKGAWSATTLYAHPGLRPMADLDLLVDETSMDAWSASLRELGYEPRDVADHATLFAHRGRGVYVELHHALTSCAGFLGVSTDRILDRSVPMAGYDHPAVRTLAIEDHLLHLTLHAAFQHGMRQAAINAWDVHLLSGRPDLDPGVFLERADQRPLRAFVYGGLALAEHVFPHPRLTRLRESLKASVPPRLEKRARKLRPEQLLSPSNGAVFGTPVSRLAWVEGPVDGLALSREILRPRGGKGAFAYVARASQLLRNHVVTPLRSANHPPSTLLTSSTKASLEEVRHV